MLKKIGQGSKLEAIFVLVSGLCLSFNSGYINGCCLSGLLSENGSHRQAVSAFTGTYTKSGLALADGQTSLFGFEISKILCFISGAFISGLLNPTAVPHELGPSYGPTFLIGSVLMIISSIFSEFDPEGKTLFYFAAAANGLQNGMTSMYTANLIRTSHLTGTSTDIGLILGQMVRGNTKNAWKFFVLVGLATSFWLGGLLSFWAVTDLQNHALFFNAALFLTLGLSHCIYIMATQHISIVQAALGTWHWDKALKELSVISRHGTPTADARIMEVFDQIDSDGSGAITASDLQEALGALGMRVDETRVNAMMRIADEDNDGVIDREGFLALADAASLRAQRKFQRRSSFQKALPTKGNDVEARDNTDAESSCSLQPTTSIEENDGNDKQVQPKPKDSPEQQARSQQQQQQQPLPRTLQEATLNPLTDPLAIVVTEATHPFNVVSVNRAWEDLCGYKSSETKGKNMKELIQGPDTDRGALASAMESLVEGAREVECLTVNYRKDRSMFWNHLRMGPLVDDNNQDGKTMYYVGILTNIAELAKTFGDDIEKGIDDNKMDDFVENKV